MFLGPARTPEPPYYAVIFTAMLGADTAGYGEMAQRLFHLADSQPGCLGYEISGDARSGIGVSYWTDEESIRAWKADADHQRAQQLGRDLWYDHYQLRIARAEREYGFTRSSEPG